MATERSQKAKALSDASKKNVLLAHKYSTKKHVIETSRKTQVSIKGWYMYEKIDGIRAYIKDGKLTSRYGNVFSAPDEFYTQISSVFPDINGLDGELVSKQGFQHTTSVVRDKTSKVSMDYWKDICFVVFDYMSCPKTTFQKRIDILDRLKNRQNDNCRLLKKIGIVYTEDCVLDTTKKLVEAGKEGLILRNPEGLYIPGRSWDLLKVKLFDDTEAEIIDYYPGEGKYSGMVGGLVCKLSDGTEFECGSGLKDSEREDPPEIGKKITVKYMGLTDAGKPRHPIFISVRDYE